MARSRYAGTQIFDGNHYGTWTSPVAGNPLGPDILDGVSIVQHVFSVGERLDTLAHSYFGDEDYWWVIALANGIKDPFSISIGQILSIPTDVRVILDKIQR